MKGGSLHSRSFGRLFFSVFRYRWSKNGFTGPIIYRVFRETGPWFVNFGLRLFSVGNFPASLMSIIPPYSTYRKISTVFKRVSRCLQLLTGSAFNYFFEEWYWPYFNNISRSVYTSSKPLPILSCRLSFRRHNRDSDSIATPGMINKGK